MKIPLTENDILAIIKKHCQLSSRNVQKDAAKEITTLLEAYDASKWKPYPENVPEYGSYLVEVKNIMSKKPLFIQAEYYGAWSGIVNSKVIAFCELPKPYNPTEK